MYLFNLEFTIRFISSACEKADCCTLGWLLNCRRSPIMLLVFIGEITTTTSNEVSLYRISLNDGTDRAGGGAGGGAPKRSKTLALRRQRRGQTQRRSRGRQRGVASGWRPTTWRGRRDARYGITRLDPDAAYLEDVLNAARLQICRMRRSLKTCRMKHISTVEKILDTASFVTRRDAGCGCVIFRRDEARGVA